MIKSWPISKKIELFAVLAGLIGLFVYLLNLTPKLPNSDVIWYMNLSIANQTDAHWLTRYTHVYLQKPFLLLAQDPLAGLHFYWVILITGSASLIYVLAQKFSKTANFINSFLAVALFLSFNQQARFAGTALSDHTGMFLALLTILVYLLSSEADHSNTKWLISLGFLFYLDLFTKETIWPVSILIIGLAVRGDDTLDAKYFWNNFKYVLGGFGLGFFLFILLNGIFLKDPLFGLRPEDLKNYLGFYAEGNQHVPKKEWIGDYLLVEIPVMFLLYIISGFKYKQENPPLRKLIPWGIPLFSIITLTIGMNGETYGLIPRLMTPFAAIINVFASQFLVVNIDEADTQKKIFHIGLGIALAIGLTAWAFGQTMRLIPEETINLSVRNIVYYSISLAVLIWSAIVWKTFTKFHFFIPLICLILLIWPSINANLYAAQRERNTNIFSAYTNFEDSFTNFSSDEKIFFSENLVTANSQFTNDKNYMMSLFNIYFKTSAAGDQFAIGHPPKNLSELNDELGFTHIYLLPQEWKNFLEATPENLLSTRCQVELNPNNSIVFLTCR